MGFGYSNTPHHPTPGATSRETGGRVKSIFTTDQAIHVWAQRTQSYGQNAKRSVYFERDVLYSYGSHWIMAQFAENDRGEVAAIVNATHYTDGTTTNGHTSQARRAIRDDIPTFSVPAAGGHLYGGRLTPGDISGALAYYATAATEAAGKAKRARSDWTRDSQTSRASALLNEAEAFAAWAGVAWTRPDLGDLVADAEEAKKRAAARQREIEEARRVQNADAFAEWLAGSRRYAPDGYATDAAGSVYLRRAGDNLETSRGAVVPWEHALRAFRFIKLCREKGEAFQSNGRKVRVGHFTVDRITAKGDMTAGCHFFTWAQIEALAKREGVLGLAPDAAAVTESGH